VPVKGPAAKLAETDGTVTAAITWFALPPARERRSVRVTADRRRRRVPGTGNGLRMMRGDNSLAAVRGRRADKDGFRYGRSSTKCSEWPTTSPARPEVNTRRPGLAWPRRVAKVPPPHYNARADLRSASHRTLGGPDFLTTTHEVTNPQRPGPAHAGHLPPKPGGTVVAPHYTQRRSFIPRATACGRRRGGGLTWPPSARVCALGVSRGTGV